MFLVTSVATVRERTTGTLERLLTMPIGKAHIARPGTDVTLFPGTLLQGDTVVGERAEIGPDTRLVDCAVGADAVIEKTMARDAEVGAGAHVGPFAVLEPGAHVDPGVATGAFYTA